jgi:hypothetical protein
VQAHKLLKANLGLGIAQVKVIRFESGKVGVKNVYIMGSSVGTSLEREAKRLHLFKTQPLLWRVQ